MTDKQVWLITGAGRGMGVDVARAALAAGHAVVATGRNPERVRSAIETQDDLLAVKLDVTDAADAEAAVQAAVDRFGRLTCWSTRWQLLRRVLRGMSPEEFRAQIETTLFGPINVTRAVLPVMRAQRSGLVVTISSTAGLTGGEFLTAYAAFKSGWRAGWSRYLRGRTVRHPHDAVEPGFFRTELLTPESTSYAESTIEDYAERTKQTVTTWNSMNGQQTGDPAKLADALVHLAAMEEPPLRFPAGADAVVTFENRGKLLLEQAGANRELSSNLAHDDA